MPFAINVGKKIGRIIWQIGIFTAFFGSFLSIKGFESFFAYRIIIGINLVVFVVSLLRYKNITIDKKMHLFYIFMLLWLLWAGLSLIWAQDKAGTLRNIVLLFCNVNLMFFTPYYLGDQKGQKYIVSAFLTVLVINIAVGIWEIFTGNHLSMSAANNYAQYMKNTPTAFYRNPNDFATYLVVYLPIVYVAFKYSSKIKASIVLYAIFAASLYVMLPTHSRANYISLILFVVAGIALPWFKYRRKKAFESIHVRKKMILAFLTVLLFFTGVTNMLLPKFDKNNSVTKQIETITTVDENNSIGERINLIKNGFKILNEKPWQYLIGVGAGNVEKRMIPYSNTTSGLTNMHNWWMELLVNYGVIIFTAFLVFYIGILRKLYSIYMEPAQEKLGFLAEALLISLILFPIAVVSPSSIMGMSSMWAILAEALALINANNNEAEVKNEEDSNILSPQGIRYGG